MSEQQTVNIKQRLIGAIVLVSLGVIFIPFLLNGGPDLKQTISGSNIPSIPKQLDKKIPKIPDVSPMPLPQPVTVHPVEEKSDKKTDVLQNDSGTLKKQAEQVKASDRQKFDKVSKPESKKIDTAYTLQVASFSQKNNAFALRDKLRKSKFKAYIESINMNNKKIYRLRVGPYLKYEQLLEIKIKLEKQFKVGETVIVKYKT